MGESRGRSASTRHRTATIPNRGALQELSTLLSALEIDDTGPSRWVFKQLQPFGDCVALSAADELLIGDVLAAPATRALPSVACGAAASLGASLPEWYISDPGASLSFFGALGARAYGTGVNLRQTLCRGIEAASRAVAGAGAAQRARAAEAAPSAAAVLANFMISDDAAEWRSRACVWEAVTALARAAPRALVPCWALFLPTEASCRVGVAGALLGAYSTAERASAADAAAALLSAGAPFVAARSRTPTTPHAIAFTTAAETAQRVVEAMCHVLATAIPLERDTDVSAKLAKAAAALAAVAKSSALSPHAIKRLLASLVKRAATGPATANTARGAALIAIAAVLNGNIGTIPLSSVDSAADILLPLLQSDDNANLPLEEALVALQAVCKVSIDTIRTRWPLIQQCLRNLAGSRREVLALHTVRAAEHILAALLTDPRSHDDALWGIEVYAAIAQQRHVHRFHAVRSSAALCAEYLLRLHEDWDKKRHVLNAARDSLLNAALGDDSHAVQCLAVRSLGALPFNCSSPNDHDSLISALLGLLQLTKSDTLQSRCAWALASLIEALAKTEPPLVRDKSVSLLQACSLEAIELLHLRTAALECGTRRSSDSDALATGIVRLLSVSMRTLRLLGKSREEDLDRAVGGLCKVVSSSVEAPKARWNACRALGDLLEHANVQASNTGVRVLLDASLSARSAKVRAAAARSLLPIAKDLGVHSCVRVFIAARDFNDAPRAQCEAHISAAAALLHGALADSRVVVTCDSTRARALIDAVAAHTELPAYVLNPRACLPPGELGTAAPSAVLGALAPESHAALAAALTAVTDALEIDPDPELTALHSHIKGLLKQN